MTASAGSVSPSAVWDALLAFQQSPGRHALTRGEPRLLFDHVLEVLQLAGDRPVSDGRGEVPSPSVRQAARFFVRTVMLRPGGTHYDVMGVRPGGDLQAVREHYRMLIRLTHPDFASDDVQWPEDAAARVNLAHDVLSSVVKRGEYDAQLKAPTPVSAPVKVSTPANVRKSSPARGRRSRRRLMAYLSGALVTGVLGVLAVGLWSSVEDASLGQAKKAEPLLNLTESSENAQSGPGGGWTPDKVFPGQVLDGNKASPVRPGVQVSRANRDVSLRSEPAVATPISAVTVASPVLKSERVLSQLPAEAPEKTAALAVPAEAISKASESSKVPVVAIDDGVAAKAEVAVPKADIRTFQPVLADLLHMLETGQIERVQRWAARATQQEAGAERFAGAYQQLLGDAVVTGLGPARFDLKQMQDRQVVSGAVQIRMVDRNQQVVVKDFRLRAQFVARSGTPQLASLDAE